MPMPLPYLLLATSDGKKMGKTEKGAVWIEASRLSVYDYYQYWVNVTDADVIKLDETLYIYALLRLLNMQKFRVQIFGKRSKS